MRIKYLLYGYGGHGKVIAEALNSITNSKIGVFDDQPIEETDAIVFLGKYNPTVFPDLPIVIGIGNNEIRKKISECIRHEFFKLIHPSAQIAKSVKIGKGSVVLQNAVIQANSEIGDHVIVNVGAVIDHDNKIGDYVHVTPLCYLGSNSFTSELICIEPCSKIPRFSQL